MIKKIEIDVTYTFQIEVDEDSEIVKEYGGDDKELIDDLVHYHFSILPVINRGVKVLDSQVSDYDFEIKN